jgi:cation transport ATPase
MLSSIRQKINTARSKITLPYQIGIIFALTIPAYMLAWGVFTSQATTYVAALSKFTVLILILFYMVGTYVTIYTKNKSRLVGWVIWFIAIALTILFCKFVLGLETRW